MRRRRLWILVAAFAALAVALAAGTAAGAMRGRSLAADDGTTTREVRAALREAERSAGVVEAADWQAAKTRLVIAAESLAEEPHVAYVWVVRASGDGQIAYASGGTGRAGENVTRLAGVVGEAARASAGWDAVGAQRYVPLAAAAMSRDGDHADVFRYLAEPVTFANGEAALIAVTYDRVAVVGAPQAAYTALLLGSLAALAVYWLGLPLWVWADASARREPAALWALLVLAANAMGLLAYAIATRRPAPESAPA